MYNSSKRDTIKCTCSPSAYSDRREYQAGSGRYVVGAFPMRCAAKLEILHVQVRLAFATVGARSYISLQYSRGKVLPEKSSTYLFVAGLIMSHPFDGWFSRLIPPHNVTGTGWLDEDYAFYSTQWIGCSYPISGRYGPTARYIHYSLILVALYGRKLDWLANAALNLIMTYSSAAAIHSLFLAIIWDNRFGTSHKHRFESVQVAGPTFAGQMTDFGDLDAPLNEADGSIWLPVAPMAWDKDCDALLAIVGTAFLALLPMQIWSKTLRTASKEKKVIVGMWGCLLAVGLVPALVQAEYNLVYTFPQLRFCPTDAADSLPFKSQRPYPYLDEHQSPDLYRWNRILGDHFVYQNFTVAFPNLCLYPCLGFQWLLRDPGDMIVLELPNYATRTAFGLLTGVKYLVTSSFMCSICVLIGTSHQKLKSRWGIDEDLVKLIQNRQFRRLWGRVRDKKILHTSRRQRFKHLFVSMFSLYISWSAYLLSPLVPLVFVAYCEWLMWVADPGVETIQHVGQWGTLAIVFVVIISTACSRLLELRAQRKSQGPRSWWRH